jgi:hypothetical protein
LKVLKPAAPLLPTTEAELEDLSVDPLIVADVRETFAELIRNGETMVFAQAGTGEQAEFAAETLRQYSPIAIEILPLSTEPEMSRALQSLSGAEPRLISTRSIFTVHLI